MSTGGSLVRLCDEEGVARQEVEVLELQSRRNLATLRDTRLAASTKRSQAAQRKLVADDLRALRTFQRRVASLEAEEKQKRQIIAHQSALLVEALLRILEKDIQGDVFDEAYHVHQREKYFQKTVEVILKSEAANRRDIIGSERYERLLLRQRGDAQASKILIRQRLAAIREKQRQAIEYVHLTHGNFDGGQSARGKGAGGHSSRAQAQPRTLVSLNQNFYMRALDALVLKEEEERVQVERAFANETELHYRTLLYVIDLKRLEDEEQNRALMDEEYRTCARHLRDVERAAAKAMQTTLNQESAARHSIERAFVRDSIQFQRHEDYETTRHITHERKMEFRRERIAITRARLEDPEPSSVANNEPEGRLNYLPAFAPVKPTLQMVKRPQPPPPTKTSSSAIYSKGTNVIIRGLVSQESALRVALERNERLERFSLSKDSVLNDELADREARARIRRETLEQQRSRQVELALHKSMSKSATFLKSVNVEASSKRQRERCQKQEATARAFHLRDENEAFAAIIRHWNSTAGVKVRASQAILIDDEQQQRAAIIGAEARTRSVLLDVFREHKPQSRIVAVEPVPAPTSKFAFSPPPFLKKTTAARRPVKESAAGSKHEVKREEAQVEPKKNEEKVETTRGGESSASVPSTSIDEKPTAAASTAKDSGEQPDSAKNPNQSAKEGDDGEAKEQKPQSHASSRRSSSPRSPSSSSPSHTTPRSPLSPEKTESSSLHANEQPQDPHDARDDGAAASPKTQQGEAKTTEPSAKATDDTSLPPAQNAPQELTTTSATDAAASAPPPESTPGEEQETSAANAAAENASLVSKESGTNDVATASAEVEERKSPPPPAQPPSHPEPLREEVTADSSPAAASASEPATAGPASSPREPEAGAREPSSAVYDADFES